MYEYEEKETKTHSLCVRASFAYSSHSISDAVIGRARIFPFVQTIIYINSKKDQYFLLVVTFFFPVVAPPRKPHFRRLSRNGFIRHSLSSRPFPKERDQIDFFHQIQAKQNFPFSSQPATHLGQENIFFNTIYTS
jgi:hypothetical protein